MVNPTRDNQMRRVLFITLYTHGAAFFTAVNNAMWHAAKRNFGIRRDLHMIIKFIETISNPSAMARSKINRLIEGASYWHCECHNARCGRDTQSETTRFRHAFDGNAICCLAMDNVEMRWKGLLPCAGEDQTHTTGMMP